MNSFIKRFKIEKRHLLAIFFVSFLFFLGNGQFDLFDNSETHYTRVTQEMVQSGDWLNLSYNGKPWYVHPPLYFWTTSIITSVFGWSETVLRFQGNLFSMGCVMMTYLIAQLFFGPSIALGSALIFGSSIYIIAIGKLAIFDAHLYFFMLLSLYIILDHIHSKKIKAHFILFAGIATGLGVLAKGPIALVQQLLFLFPYLIYLKRWDLFKSKWVWGTIAISILLPAPWYAHQLLHHGKPFFDLALRDYTWYRFFGVVESQSGPWHYYFTVLLGFFPWLCWLPFIITAQLKSTLFKKQTLQSQGIMFSWIATIITFLFFSVAQTKLPNYIYLMFPFMSILASHWFLHLKQYKQPLSILLIFGLLIIAIGFNITIYDLEASRVLLIKLTFVALSLPILGVALGAFLKKSKLWSLTAFVGISYLSIFWLTFIILPKVSDYDEVKKGSAIILEDVKNEPYTMVHYYGIKPSTLVRLNTNLLQLRSDTDLLTTVTENPLVYVLSHQKYINDTLLQHPFMKASWTYDDHIVLKYSQE